MAWPLVRIDLDERSRDFQKIALQPGFPVLDRFAANAHVLRQWLGRFIADAVWDEQTVRFLWRDDDESSPPTVVQAAHLSDLRGSLRSEVEALRAKLKQVAPKTPNDRILLGVMQQRLDRALAGETDIPGMFCKVRVRGRWRLVWCWGYERRHTKSAPLAICTQDGCRLAFFDDVDTRHRCPRCGKKIRTGGLSRVVAIVALLLLLVGGGGMAWQLSGRPGLVNSTGLEGAVVDAVSGQPIPAATVHLSSDAQTRTQTNAAGQFQLAFQRGGDDRLEIAAPGYVPLTWVPPPSKSPTEPHVIGLRGASDVMGLVVEAGTDRPIPFPAIHAIQPGHRGTGDDVGLFLLPGVPSGTVEFEVSAEGYQPVRVTNELKPGRSPDLLISLPGAATARGSVIDIFNKQPIANAVIKVLDTSGESISDDKGQFQREGLPGTVCRFEVAASGYFTREFERPLAPTGETTLRFLLRPELTSLEGVLVDSSGAPISAGTVRMAGLDSPTKTSADGRFTLSGLRKGTHRVEVAARGYPPRTVEVTVPAPNNEPARIALAGSEKLVGQVVDAVRKTPVKEAEVRVADGRWKTKTDEQGRFEIAKLPSGPVSLEVIGRGYRAATSEPTLSSGASPVEITLRGATVLSGTVTSLFDQQPIAGADVRLEGTTTLQKSDAEGKFRFEDVVAGMARVNVSADGYQPENAERETRTDEETPVPVALRGAAKLSGRVVTAESGRPIEKAVIEIVGTDRKLTTDALGEFAQEDWPARPIRLKAVANGYSPEEFDHDLSAAAIPPLVMRLKPPHAVRGVVVDARNDKPLAGAKVALVGTADSTASDADGHFQFVTPQSPSYEFSVTANGYPPQTFVERSSEDKPALFKLALQRDSEQTPVAQEHMPPPSSSEPAPATDQFGTPPPTARDPLEVEFFGVRTKAANVGFAVDRSGSMSSPRIDRTKLELLKSVLNLHPKQIFYVAFFNEGAVQMWGGESSPVPASPLNKVRTYKWMKTIPAEGGTDPQPALRMVAAMSPQSIFLLTDGGFSPLPDDLYGEFQRKKIRVNTLAFEDEAGKPILQEIASRTGGTYRFVPAEPIPEFQELELVTRLFDELLEQWLDPKTAAADAREAHEALVEFCNGEDFGPRAKASDSDRRHARTAWRRWWVERKLTPEVVRQDEGRGMA